MKRIFDIFVVVSGGLVLGPLLFCAAVAVKATSKGPVLYWSERVGRYNRRFNMPKFRTMKLETPAVATHLLNNPASYLTPIGGFLRSTSIDELPQLWSVLVGDMSLVGPRPALFNQENLIDMRTERGVESLRPGITGLAQISGRDELSISYKVELDADYLRQRSFLFDLKVLYLTISRVISRDSVSH